MMDQPRIPAGNSQGGQWTSGSVMTLSNGHHFAVTPERVAAADARMFDYEHAANVKDLARGTSSQGSLEEREDAAILSRLAHESTSAHREVWRGVTGTGLKHNQVVSLDHLASASSDRSIAAIYTTDQTGSGAKGYLLRIEARERVKGYDRQHAHEDEGGRPKETLLSGSARYRVTGAYEENGLTVYRLYEVR